MNTLLLVAGLLGMFNPRLGFCTLVWGAVLGMMGVL